MYFIWNSVEKLRRDSDTNGNDEEDEESDDLQFSSALLPGDSFPATGQHLLATSMADVEDDADGVDAELGEHVDGEGDDVELSGDKVKFVCYKVLIHHLIIFYKSGITQTAQTRPSKNGAD